jgi:hypothetical protein
MTRYLKSNLRLEDEKAMRRRIALQSASREITGSVFLFHEAFWSATRTRVALERT